MDRRMASHHSFAARLLADGCPTGGRDSQLRLWYPGHDEYLGGPLPQAAREPDERTKEHPQRGEEAL